MSSLEQLYQQVILDHAKERHGHDGGLDLHGGHVDASTLAPRATAEGVSAASRQRNPLCGDEVLLQVTVAERDAVPYVVGVSWGGDGCSISQAATSVMHDLTVDRPVAEVETLLDTYRTMIRSRGSFEVDEEVLGDAAAFSGVGRHANRVKCAMLGWSALEDAVHRAVPVLYEATPDAPTA
ncbi:MAG: SUF system NifU family Fe-S cluster assembly protein [Kineosporiaceae bacterium]